MTDIVLSPITSGYNLSKINSNFVKIATVINNDVLHLEGGNNTMQQDLDMNGNSFINVATDVNDPDSLITVGDADLRYYNVDGDTLAGTMNVGGQTITGLKVPTGVSEPVRKDMFDDEVSARAAEDASIRNDFTSADAQIIEDFTAGDAYLQAQISGGEPLAASAFSMISWHDQVILGSVTIPDNKNAWSFGPTMTIAPGQTVTVGTDSFWTIANGEVA